MPYRLIPKTVVEGDGTAFEWTKWSTTEPAPGVIETDWMPATNVSFRRSPGDMDFDFHRAPRRRLVINTAGRLQVTATNGDDRVMEPGEILHVTDVSGRGHRSTCRSPDGLFSIFLALDDALLNSHIAPLATPEAGPPLLSATTGGLAESRLPYRFGGPSGVVTEEFAVQDFQVAWAVSAAERPAEPGAATLICPIAGTISVHGAEAAAGAIIAAPSNVAAPWQAVTPAATVLTMRLMKDDDLPT